MALSYDLLSQFAKLVNDGEKKSSEATVYGTVVDENGNKYVRLDGSDAPEALIPITDTSADVQENERVSVLIKDHTATVTGNMSSPAARVGDVVEVKQAGILLAERVQATEANIGTLNTNVANLNKLTAADGKITNLEAANLEVTKRLEAAEADIDTLESTQIKVEDLDAKYATIGSLDAVKIDVNELSADHATFKEATVSDFEAVNATIDNLKTKDAEIEKLVAGAATIEALEASNAEIENLKTKDAEIEDLVAEKATIEALEAVDAKFNNLNAAYANIDFANIGEAAFKKIFSGSGLIKDLVVGNQTITGEIVGVTISGDLIKANTLMADKLVVRGSDGNYYKLNTDFTALEGVTPVEEDSIHGSNIIAKSITADRLKVTDLVAFGATIGGFKINTDSLCSVAKPSVDNTTRGIYLDNTGQMAIGDATNFIKFYESDGNYKLEISASSLKFSTSNKNVEEVLTDLENLEIGGRNLLPDTDFNGESMIRTEPEGGTGEGGFNFYPTVQIESGVEYTVSARIRGTSDVVFYEINEGGNISHHWIKKANLSDTDYQKFSYTFVVPADRTFKNAFICTKYGTTVAGEWFEIEPSSLKLERGSKATDWTPAPEDMASVADLADYATKSEVTQTEDRITLSVTTKLGDYYTKAETDSKISVKSDSITSTVREEIASIQVGGRNLLTNSRDEKSGGTSEFMQYGDLAPIFDEYGLIEYTISFDIKSADISQQDTMQVYCQNGSTSKYSIGTHRIPVTTEYVRHSITVTPSLNDETETESYLAFYGTYDSGNIPSVKNVKVERGNKATDWTPAPEDVDSAIDDVEATANRTSEWATAAESTIQQLSNCISTLVIDENGESLMTQTEDGWTFSMKETNETISSLSSGLDTLQSVTGDTQATVAILQQTISDHGNTLEYVNITTYEDEPCIELGESDSEFKLLITNTRIMFMNGSNVPTYINTDGVVTENIEVRKEIRQGNWVWVTHGNGNLGLMWKEVTE